ncbi:MAG: hypothetical protein NTX59_10980 [Elusimicrobia bacterium]|nr:hypothetical protein [Elusimicrobiota bacterium]
MPQLIAVYDTYKNTGRPIYILAHSWGAVIMHDVMHRVAKIRPDVQIDKFITIGTPLMSRWMISPITNYQVNKFHLLKVVSKPVNLRYWKNIWARRDPFSNIVPAADLNVQIDESLGFPEIYLTSLGAIRMDLRLQIDMDLLHLMNVHAWHKSYYKGFKTILKSINRKIDVEVFDSQIAPEIAACTSKSYL